MKVLEYIAKYILTEIVLDSGGFRNDTNKPLYQLHYTQQDLKDLTAVLETFESNLGLLDLMCTNIEFAQFSTVFQDTQVIDYIISPEQNEFKRFLEVHPEYNAIQDILKRHW